MEYLELQLPENVQKIITTLQMYGYEAYAVGGCVRDSLLNRTPGDWDITTSAMPGETKALFDKTFDTGIEHGTVTVVFGREGYEVTTYRIDGEYTDSRHPREVTFTRSLKEDLLRRDFTINAMAYNDKDGLIDIFGGKEDLQGNVSGAWEMPKNVSAKMHSESCEVCVLLHSWDLIFQKIQKKVCVSWHQHLEISVRNGYRWSL